MSENKKYIIIFVFIVLITTSLFWNNSNKNFQNDSESLVVSMIAAGRYNFDIGTRTFGMGSIVSTEGGSLQESYNVYWNPDLFDNVITERNQQIGLQGWVFYFMAWVGIPRPLSAFRLGCSLVLAIVLVLICNELKKRYGLLFAGIFFIISISSSWLTNFAPNLYWVTFTWFIPMLLGLICLNNLNRRRWLYPLFLLSILIRSATAYEYITVIMLSSIMFLVVEWICSLKKDKGYSKVLFKAIFTIGVVSLLGFLITLLVHSYMRGDGNILNGLDAIYRQDVLRRTFGNADDFGEVFANSLNASIVDVLVIYLRGDKTGILARRLLIAISGFLFYKHIIKRRPVDAEFWLFVVSFLTCISWFVFGKSHSYIHAHMNYVLWYMGFIQVSVYIVVKTILQQALSDNGKQLLMDFFQKIRLEVNLGLELNSSVDN